MTHTPTRPGPRARPRRRLALALLLVAVLAIACGGSDQAAVVLGQVRSGLETPDDGHRGTTHDASRPAVANLDPDLREALEAAMRAAREDGVDMVLTSGWRSRAHQQRLFEEAVSRYGSEQEALRYVATPDASAHVTGDAVDIGPTDAADWLIQHGAEYGLCQVFANEMWHFELATAPGRRCPPPLPDSSYRS